MDKHTLDQFLATPAIYSPNMNEQEWQAELEGMLERSLLTYEFVNGNVSPNDFMDGLYQFGVDPLLASERWENGLSFLY